MIHSRHNFIGSMLLMFVSILVCSIFAPVAHAQLFNPAQTLDPNCAPSACSVFIGINVGTSTATSTVSSGVFYIDGTGIIQQSNNLQFGALANQLALDGLFTLVSSTTPSVIVDTLYNNAGTLTFNGQAIGAGVNGTGTATQIALWSGAGTLVSTSTLFVDAVNGRVGVGTSALQDVLHIATPDVVGNYGLRLEVAPGAGNPAMFFEHASGLLTTFFQFTDRMEVHSSGAGSNLITFADHTGLSHITFDKIGTTTFSTNVGLGTTTESSILNPLTVVSNGSALSAAIAFDDFPNGGTILDVDTGIFKVQADTIGFTTGGTERMRIGSSTGNVSIRTALNDLGEYDALIVGGQGAGSFNNGITTLNDLQSAIMLGRFSPAVPNAYMSMATTSARFTWTNNTDTANVMSLSSVGRLLVGAGILSTSNPLAILHASATASTTNIMRLQNNVGDVDMFVLNGGVPEGFLTGSPGDVAFIGATAAGSTTAGALWVKRSGVSTNTGWVEIRNASSTCAVNDAFACIGGNTLGSALTIGTNDAESLMFMADGTYFAEIDTSGDFILSSTTRKYQIGSTSMMWHGGETSNFYLGTGAGSSTNITGLRNTFVGSSTGASITSGNDNTAIGAWALTLATSSSNNVAVGSWSMASSTAGTENVAIGRLTLRLATSSMRNVAIGESAMDVSATTSADNVAIGVNTLGAAGQVGTSSVAIGGQNLAQMTTGNNNIAVGTVVLDVVTLGSLNIGIAGQGALGGLTTGSNNIAIGNSALIALTTQSDTLALGEGALDILTTGTHNMAIGRDVLGNTATGIGNLGIGDNAIRASTANYSLGLGSYAFDGNGGLGNFAIGTDAVGALTVAAYRYGIGHNALLSQTGASSFAIGHYALDASTGVGNMAIGLHALGNLTTGTNNLAIGQNAHLAVTLGATGNMAIGTNALRVSSTITSGAMAIGYNALSSLNNNGNTNTAIGTNALALGNVTSMHSVAVGRDALASHGTVGASNIAIGRNAIRTATSTSNNLAIGFSALDEIASSVVADTIAIGTNAVGGVLGILGGGNVGIGHQALATSTNGRNVAIGTFALTNNATGTHNVAVGFRSMFNTLTGTSTIAIGTESLFSATAASSTVAVGRNTLYANIIGTSTLAIGDSALAQSTGGNNIVVGNGAGDQITTGSGNIIIGHNLETSSPTANNEINIGGVIFGYTLTSGTPYVGIKNQAPAFTLHVGSGAEADGVALIRTEDANSTCDFTAQGGAPACGSDRRLKKDIEDIDTGLTEILALRPVTYHWNKESNSEEKHTGFIAQEVEAVLPELVTEREDGIKLLSTGGMMPTVVKAIQEQNTLVEDLEAQILSGQIVAVSSTITLGQFENLTHSGSLTLLGHVALGMDAVGEALIQAGHTEVTVRFARSYERTPVITATVRAALSGEYWTSDQTENGFTITLREPQQSDIYFDWHAFMPLGAVQETVSDAPITIETSTQEQSGTEDTETSSLEETPESTPEAPEAVETSEAPEDVSPPVSQESTTPEESQIIDEEPAVEPESEEPETVTEEVPTQEPVTPTE